MRLGQVSAVFRRFQNFYRERSVITLFYVYFKTFITYNSTFITLQLYAHNENNVLHYITSSLGIHFDHRTK